MIGDVLHFHPPISVFPSALIPLVCILEVIAAWRPSGKLPAARAFNLIAAGIGTVAAFFSGYHASDYANQSFLVADEVIATHHVYGRALLFTLLPCITFFFVAEQVADRSRKTILVACYRFCLALSLGLVVMTGFLGGRLVFQHGAGVKIEGIAAHADPASIKDGD